MGILRSDEINTHSPVSTTFDERTGFILAHLDKVDFGYVDQPIRYLGRIFQPKEELHITIVSQDAGLILKHLENHPDDIDDILDLVISIDWTYSKLDEFYHVQAKPDVETIIQMVEIPALRGFFKDLSKLIGQGFILSPTHVTLYTRGTDKGIPIPDQQSFQQLVKGEIQPNDVRLAEDASAGRRNEQGPA